MKTSGLNPYLPFWETVPDGEPHVFGDRVYIYGSHDRLGGTSFCEEDYVCWSAPVEEPGVWTCEGVIYKKMQDPLNGAPYGKTLPEIGMPLGTEENPHLLYAPDVAQGPDGRYYLYYALDFVNVISVAVCDTPAGQYEFLDFVRREDGTIPDAGRWFDPAILSEESGNYLYYGFAPARKFPGMEQVIFPGAMMVKLAQDMHTIISEPKCVANGIDTAKGTSYEAHPFFEASSIRKLGNRYYFVYSSLQGHELCYGTADTPEGPFAYKGVIVSNGDLGYEGNNLAVNYTGNNHGGLERIGDRLYIFWHRHTHGTAFSRQGCADAVKILEDGTIPQIEITSCGLHDGPLPAKGAYDSCIACHLTEADREQVGQVVMSGPGEAVPELPEEMPYITEEADETGEKGLKPYIRNLRTGSAAGFKYFQFEGTESRITVELRGLGCLEVRADSPDPQAGTMVGSAAVDSKNWKHVTTGLQVEAGKHALYFLVKEGTVDFASFEIA
ncbi:hypothetical protein EBB54_06160 [Schaedlerella arabinosiphila]|uniref:Alpha-N-arabinofuranosidase n=1 Tax=Schaedlerella arabinosiphila TaxID=2044587 RepID=A0A3R8JKI0_9FIRM|nr:family 43 glycosylhydrolase [Schaedlerella arabinosiphila]RRK31000.1 hypothetical protein EBB54_06160 [Schaedlerella arabinosiphila]